MKVNNLNQVIAPGNKRPISGIVATAMVAMTFVTYENDTVPETDRRLVKASGKGRAAILEREVMTEANWQAAQASRMVIDNYLKTPLAEGDTVSARFPERMLLEGTALLDAGITTATPVDSPLTTLNGKLKVWASGADGEIVGYLRKFHPKLVNANACRIEVEFVQ